MVDLMHMDKVEEAVFRERIRQDVENLAQIPEVNLSALGRAAGMSPTEVTRARESGTGGIEKLKQLGTRIAELREVLREESPEGHEESAEQFIKSRECPECGEESPGFFRGRTLIYCGFCGAHLGKECFKCGHLNIDPKAQFCAACGHPLTDEAAKAMGDVQGATEKPEERARREDRERLERQRQRRERGEPEM